MKKNVIIKLKRLLFKNYLTSDDMRKLLEEKGIAIGKGTIFYEPGKSTIDLSRPCLLEIGEFCKITSGVIILTHDYSRSVLRRVYGEIIGEGRKTIIKNNVFIGMNSIILMGSVIGNNVIIGAGSVVSGVIPDDVVIAGNPAKIIRKLSDHYEICKKRNYEEACQYVHAFKEFYHRIPTIKEMNPFFPLFLKRDLSEVKKHGISLELGGDDYEDIVDNFLRSPPPYNSYEEFLISCGINGIE